MRECSVVIIIPETTARCDLESIQTGVPVDLSSRRATECGRKRPQRHELDRLADLGMQHYFGSSHRRQPYFGTDIDHAGRGDALCQWRDPKSGKGCCNHGGDPAADESLIPFDAGP